MAETKTKAVRKPRKNRTIDEQTSATTLTLLRQTVRRAGSFVENGTPMPPQVCGLAMVFVADINKWLATANGKPDANSAEKTSV